MQSGLVGLRVRLRERFVVGSTAGKKGFWWLSSPMLRAFGAELLVIFWVFDDQITVIGNEF